MVLLPELGSTEEKTCLKGAVSKSSLCYTYAFKVSVLSKQRQFYMEAASSCLELYLAFQSLLVLAVSFLRKGR